MFYLLEDNTIIDGEKLSVRVNEYQGKQFLARDSKNRYVLGKIKDKSNNIFNLVKCCQDLIETEEGQFYKPLKLQIDSFVVKYDCCVLFNGIKAIYKPDDKGNYIKVWKRKEI